MGTDIEWAVFLIVTEIMTPKALGEGRYGLENDGDMDNSSGSRKKDLCSIRELLEKGPIESEDSFIDSSIVRFRLNGGGRGAPVKGGEEESRDKRVDGE